MEAPARLEAAATVKLDDRGTDSAFLYSPYWIDLLIHISSFVMNGNETLDHHLSGRVSLPFMTKLEI